MVDVNPSEEAEKKPGTFQLTVTAFRCRCGNEWTARRLDNTERPRVCPACKSANWIGPTSSDASRSQTLLSRFVLLREPPKGICLRPEPQFDPMKVSLCQSQGALESCLKKQAETPTMGPCVEIITYERTANPRELRRMRREETLDEYVAIKIRATRSDAHYRLSIGTMPSEAVASGHTEAHPRTRG